MEIGAAIFFTDYSMAPTELAVVLEERGFDSLWVAEHSHIPVTRRFSHPLDDQALTKEYYDVMDPFVTLSAAAAVTTRLKLGTAVCLVIQRDTIQTAKLVASLDQVSKGRFLFGIGCGWNAEEMEDHGTVYETRTKKMREQIEAMSRCRSRTRQSSSAAPSASPRAARSVTAAGCFPRLRAPARAAPRISCRACGRWRKKLDATRNRCR